LRFGPTTSAIAPDTEENSGNGKARVSKLWFPEHLSGVAPCSRLAPDGLAEIGDTGRAARGDPTNSGGASKPTSANRRKHCWATRKRAWLQSPDFWIERLHPDDRNAVLAYYRTGAPGETNHDLEYRMITASGLTIWLRNIVKVIVESGKPVKLRGVMVDITQKKTSEEAPAPYGAS
jgi:hypothetical protein